MSTNVASYELWKDFLISSPADFDFEGNLTRAIFDVRKLYGVRRFLPLKNGNFHVLCRTHSTQLFMQSLITPELFCNFDIRVAPNQTDSNYRIARGLIWSKF